MVSPKVLRRRIRSVQSTAKITRAMEMIATAKMKKAQDMAIAGRPYSDKITQVIADLSAQAAAGGATHPLLVMRPVKKIGIIHITSDRGLCGGLNTNLNRLTGNFILQSEVPVSVITVGTKGRDFMRRSMREIRAEFIKLGDRPKMADTMAISHIIIDDYVNGLIDRVYVSYSKFINLMSQKPTLQPILPVEPAVLPKTVSPEYIFEPDAAQVLDDLLPRFVEMQVYHAVLEAVASEQSARMMAMRNATDNAYDVIAELTLTLNKARQEMITKELLDIVAGVEGLK
ncbi:MAG: ATP synthase F1 subunit gamma [Dehalococcoidia bacterium]|nr:ATP synthase F1 subunit gamma [Dehalococcoidia bacterium]MDD5494824.1 ATP synthase F1 subunit gamma [Dehalococcoidia bacterium]